VGDTNELRGMVAVKCDPYTFLPQDEKDAFDLCEVFTSIQGEGRDSGAHALFIRLNGCNLRCPWCDTKYSWETGRFVPQEKILREIKEYQARYGSNYIVWTGGEPLLQEEQIYKVILKTRDFYHLLETNGTIIPSRSYLFNAIAVSPKEEFYPEWLSHHNAYVKLVVDDIEKAVKFQSLYHVPSQWFFVMQKTLYPFNLPEHLAKEKELARGCIQHGYNFSPRLQLYFEVK